MMSVIHKDAANAMLSDKDLANFNFEGKKVTKSKTTRSTFEERKVDKVSGNMFSRFFGMGRKSTENIHEDAGDMLKGHLCLITGASRGIGSQIALEFAKRGASLILVAQDEDRLNRVAEDCRKHGARACYVYPADLVSRQEVENLCNEIIKNHEKVNVLVNNAGIASQGGLTALKGDPMEWEQMINLNLVTPMHFARRFAPLMVESGYGVIINMGSLAALDAVGAMGSYCASKWGIRGWSLSLHNQLKEHGVKVCLLNPAGTLTDFAKDFANTIPERFLVPKDIAEACLLPFRSSINCVPSEITLRFAKMPYKRT